MAFITKPKKKTNDSWKDPIKVKARQRIYQNSRWQRLRAFYLSEHPLCEDCFGKGIVKEAIDVHHVLSFTTDINLAYDYANLRALCKECHQLRHHAKKYRNPL